MRWRYLNDRKSDSNKKKLSADGRPGPGLGSRTSRAWPADGQGDASGFSVRPANRIRRLIIHLSRSRARAGFVVAAICIVGYAMVPDISFREPVRQFCLVLASVAAAAIFLPELSSNLWTLTSQQVRTLIPEEKRRGLAQALIGAESMEPYWGELVYREAYLPLLQVGQRPWHVVHSMNYAAQIHLDQVAQAEGVQMAVHSVATVSVSERILPPSGDGFYWVSVARSQSALMAEFTEARCLSRELVPLGDIEGELWSEVARGLCNVAVHIDGQFQQTELEEYDPAFPDVVRWRFNPGIDGMAPRVPVRIAVDFPISSAESSFPAIFSGYYCSGPMLLSLRLYHGVSATDLSCQPYFARRLGAHRDEGRMTTVRRESCEEMSFSTGRDSIMWPGSGVIFSWRKLTADRSKGKGSASETS